MPDPIVTTGLTAAPHYEDVDVAIVAESTYPYLKGGVSAVVHDIVQGNQDLTFGIIHITWDSSSPAEDLYGMPANVKWVRPVYLSMDEHGEDFKALRPKSLRMRRSERTVLAHRLIDALEAIVAGDVAPMWQLYDEGMNPRTRSYPIWALLGTKEFMEVLPAPLAQARPLPGGHVLADARVLLSRLRGDEPGPAERRRSTTPTPPATPPC